jgi:hypothetical protein
MLHNHPLEDDAPPELAFHVVLVLFLLLLVMMMVLVMLVATGRVEAPVMLPPMRVSCSTLQRL